FAYLFGRMFGKHKLLEAVSASKTWEGFMGGALFCVLVPLALWKVLSAYSVDAFMELQVWDVVIVSGGAVLFAPLGDLIESRIKRLYGVKDSGSLLPGHGGVFDRIDALLVMAPFTSVYAFLIRPMWFSSLIPWF